MPLIITLPFRSPACLTADTLLEVYAGPGGSGNYQGITVDDNGHIWVADSIGTIREFDPVTETYINAYAFGTTQPRGMVYDGLGFIWIAGYGGSIVRKMNISTGVFTTIASITTAWDAVKHPDHKWVWISKDNSPNQITGYDSTGVDSPVTFSVNSSPEGIYADSLGNVWDSNITGHQLHHYNFNTTTRTPIVGTSGVQAIGEGNDGFIYASRPSTGQMYKVDKSTLLLIQTISGLGTGANDTGQLLTDSAGYIWTANKVFDPDSQTIITTVSGAPTTQDVRLGGKGTVQSPIDGHIYTIQYPESNLYRMACSS